MLKQIILGALAIAVTPLLTPSTANAYGAAHVGYTHVGPSGVYHTGQTVARGPGGTYAGGHTNAYGYGGNSYHSGYAGGTTSGGAYHYGTSGTTGGYHYVPSYSSGGAYGRSATYSYVR